MEFRNIKVFGEPVLRERANPVERFDAELLGLVKRMKKIMKEAEGVGLAAPQIGVPLRVVTIDVGEEGRFTMVNPEITWYSEEKELFEEGCLSFPGVTVNIERPARVKAVYFDEYGNKRSVEADGLLARAIQHEIDHLDGVLIIDRAGKEEKIKVLEQLNQFFEEQQV